jgi:hypothetical protein
VAIADEDPWSRPVVHCSSSDLARSGSGQGTTRRYLYIRLFAFERGGPL